MSLQIGILYGFLDGVAGILARFKQKVGPDVFTVSTGGYGGWIAEHLDAIQSNDPNLVLHGIRLIATGQLPQG
jgi:type III pantothenate kinase